MGSYMHNLIRPSKILEYMKYENAFYKSQKIDSKK